MATAACFLLQSCAAIAPATDLAIARAQVMSTERAFAKTMADRDLAAFESFVADEAIFFDGKTALRGKKAVVESWAAFFKGATPPFSWEPDQVEVLASGALAISSGPIRGPDGKITARFNSIWRLEHANTWRVVFDKGSAACDCKVPLKTGSNQ